MRCPRLIHSGRWDRDGVLLGVVEQRQEPAEIGVGQRGGRAPVRAENDRQGEQSVARHVCAGDRRHRGGSTSQHDRCRDAAGGTQR